MKVTARLLCEVDTSGSRDSEIDTCWRCAFVSEQLNLCTCIYRALGVFPHPLELLVDLTPAPPAKDRTASSFGFEWPALLCW